MKIILTGCTGTVGGGVLRRSIAHPGITSIVALTRRELDVKDPKINNIVISDFKTYDDATLEQLKGAEACIWALGSPTSGEEVHIGYTNAAVQAFMQDLVPRLPPGKKFRFIYTSGGLVPYLTFWSKLAVRDTLDKKLLKLGEDHTDKWESYVVRPWFVVNEPSTFNKLISGSHILIPELGSAMVDLALNGNEKRLVDNAYAREVGQQALKLQPS